MPDERAVCSPFRRWPIRNAGTDGDLKGPCGSSPCEQAPVSNFPKVNYTRNNLSSGRKNTLWETPDRFSAE